MSTPMVSKFVGSLEGLAVTANAGGLESAVLVMVDGVGVAFSFEEEGCGTRGLDEGARKGLWLNSSSTRGYRRFSFLKRETPACAGFFLILIQL